MNQRDTIEKLIFGCSIAIGWALLMNYIFDINVFFLFATFMAGFYIPEIISTFKKIFNV